MCLADSKPTAPATRHDVTWEMSSQSSLTPTWCRVCARQAARPPGQAGKYRVRKVMPSFLTNTRKAGSGPVAQTTKESHVHSRVCAIGRVDIFVLGEGCW